MDAPPNVSEKSTYCRDLKNKNCCGQPSDTFHSSYHGLVIGRTLRMSSIPDGSTLAITVYLEVDLPIDLNPTLIY